MIRWPGARSLLDYRARRGEHGPVRVESSRKSEVKDRREWRILEEPCTSLNGLRTEWGPPIPPYSAFHGGAHEQLSSGRAFWESSAVLQAAFQRGDTCLRQREKDLLWGPDSPTWYQEPGSLQDDCLLTDYLKSFLGLNLLPNGIQSSPVQARLSARVTFISVTFSGTGCRERMCTCAHVCTCACVCTHACV